VQALVVVSGDPVEGDFLDVRETLQGAGSERGTTPDRFVLGQSHHSLERGLIVGISDRSDRGDETFECPDFGGLHQTVLREFIPSSQYTSRGYRSLRGPGAAKRRWTRSAGIFEAGSRFVVNMLFDRPSPERKRDA